MLDVAEFEQVAANHVVVWPCRINGVDKGLWHRRATGQASANAGRFVSSATAVTRVTELKLDRGQLAWWRSIGACGLLPPNHHCTHDKKCQCAKKKKKKHEQNKGLSLDSAMAYIQCVCVKTSYRQFFSFFFHVDHGQFPWLSGFRRWAKEASNIKENSASLYHTISSCEMYMVDSPLMLEHVYS